MTPPTLTPTQVVERYDAVLLDSYGVLVDGGGALPGARAFIESLQHAGRKWLVVSNDASRSLQASAARYTALQLPIDSEHIVVSAALIAPYFRSADLVGARAIVLGPPDSHAWVAAAGGIAIPWSDPEPDAVVVCDDAGFAFVPAVEALISTLVRRIEGGHRVALVLPNPDLVYPAGAGQLALTAGAAALLIQSALAAVFGDGAPTFVGLGKPHAPIFDEACRRLGIAAADRDKTVMLGDQRLTDIAGAAAAGLASGLVGTGVTSALAIDGGPQPTFMLPSLRA